MTLPHRFPGLRVVLVTAGLYAVVWMAQEGDLTRVVVFGVALSGLLILVALERWLGGRSLPLARWIALAAVAGLGWGAGSVLVIFLLMALKTGVHAHGPEFTSQEILWVWHQLPEWAVAGLLVGAATGMLVAALTRARSRHLS